MAATIHNVFISAIRTPLQTMREDSEHALVCLQAGDQVGAIVGMANALKAASTLIEHLMVMNENYRGVALHASQRGRDSREGGENG